MMNLLQRIRIVVIVLTLLSSTSDANADVGWPADFEALKAGLAPNYANFEYTLTDRRIDLPTIAARHREALASAGSEPERRQVFERLLADFRDPHVSIAWPSQSSRARANVACPSDLAAAAASSGVLFHRLPAFEALGSSDGETFRAGVLRVPGRETQGSSGSAYSCTKRSPSRARRRPPRQASNPISLATIPAQTRFARPSCNA